MGWFDVHAHLTDRRLAAREDEVLANARAAGVSTIISNGLNPADNQRVAELAARPERVAAWGDAARARALAEYERDAVVGRQADLYDELLGAS